MPLLSKTPISIEEVGKYANGKYGKLIAVDFAEEGAPVSGIAYWKVMVVKGQGRLFIIETLPDGNELKSTLGIIV